MAQVCDSAPATFLLCGLGQVTSISLAFGLLLCEWTMVPGSLHASRQDSNLHQHVPFPSIATKLANFALSLYHELAHQSNNNIIVSPVNIGMAFAKLSLGTKDFNFKETPKATVHKGLQHFLHTLNLSDGQFQLASRTILFSDKNQKEVHTFLETVMKLSHFSINLRDTEEATKQINQYIEKETQGKTVGLELNPDTVLILANYIFFKGKTFSDYYYYYLDPSAVCLSVFCPR
uniref:Serpin domain-containing protein n=1 Tax=Ursus americanus TaxID=9643 RepID=A0A452RLL7_URSAM